MKGITPRTVSYYEAKDGRSHFLEFYNKLDRSLRIRIDSRMARVRVGNFGDHKSVGGGVWELRFQFGLRIYFGCFGDELVLLLCGGFKDDQHKDIELAHRLWEEHNNGC